MIGGFEQPTMYIDKLKNRWYFIAKSWTRTRLHIFEIKNDVKLNISYLKIQITNIAITIDLNYDIFDKFIIRVNEI